MATQGRMLTRGGVERIRDHLAEQGVHSSFDPASQTVCAANAGQHCFIAVRRIGDGSDTWMCTFTDTEAVTWGKIDG